MKPSARSASTFLATLLAAAPSPADDGVPFDIRLEVISSGFDQKTCWVHPRAGILPGKTPGEPPAVVLTMNKLQLTGSDVFYAINHLKTADLGKTWTSPKPNPEALGRWENENGTTRSICDFWPKWHEASGKLLGIGQTVWYGADNKVMKIRPRHAAYSVYDPATDSWSRRKNLELPDDPKFANAGAGSAQRVDLPDGRILLPLYSKEMEAGSYFTTVALCRFDGETLRYEKHGSEMTVPESRGLYEPSVTRFRDRFFLTMRNDRRGYVASGTDGLHFDAPQPWRFEDGSELGSYNTQQHWVAHRNALYLVYTRRGADNDHVFRHRAPLFIAEVDPEKLHVIRRTERVLVPEHGARLGNFGVTEVSPAETWVTTAEWMQTTGPDPHDFRVPMKYGADNRVYAARILWRDPNESARR
ncbi:MAG: hypothetical protein R3F11_33155 [Verrucomicrobiales bacterium]